MMTLIRLWVSMLAALVLLSYGTPDAPKPQVSPLQSPIKCENCVYIGIAVQRRIPSGANRRGLNYVAPAPVRGFVWAWR